MRDELWVAKMLKSVLTFSYLTLYSQIQLYHNQRTEYVVSV